MELRQLRTFAAAAEFENFTRAAESLEVTQPAVSQQVAALEYELGVPLFRRIGRSVCLTDAGRHLYVYARKALDLLDKASQDVGHTKNVVSGLIRIASCSVATETFVPELIAAFRHVYPNVREVVTVTDAETATRAVRTGSADLGFTVVHPRGTRLHTKEILCHEFVLIASPEHRLATCESVTPSQLSEQSFIVPETTSGTRHTVECALESFGIQPDELKITLETDSNDAARGAVKKGIGLAFVTKTAAADDLSQGRLVAIDVRDLHIRQSVYVVTNPDQLPTAAARAFLTFV